MLQGLVGFPVGPSGKKNSPASSGDVKRCGFKILGSGGSPGGGHDKYSCLKNSMDRGALRTTAYRVTELDMTNGLAHRHAHIHKV